MSFGRIFRATIEIQLSPSHMGSVLELLHTCNTPKRTGSDTFLLPQLVTSWKAEGKDLSICAMFSKTEAPLSLPQRAKFVPNPNPNPSFTEMTTLILKKPAYCCCIAMYAISNSAITPLMKVNDVYSLHKDSKQLTKRFANILY